MVVERSSLYYGYHDDDYIFCPRSKRMTANSIDHTLYRYCHAIGMTPKSAHKIRKTYISLAFTNRIDLDTICKIARHVDLKTTFQSYIFSLERKDDVYLKFNEIFQNATK